MDKKIKCAYHLCNKDVEESKTIERILHFMHGTLSKDEPRKYCGEACAEKDQMAHEL
ncbi:YdaE family protein [Salmonella enterica]|uniref:YdaE family protein n=1 Tax=Salmonella enterica TaxID=28901 RepID=UPI003CF28B89